MLADGLVITCEEEVNAAYGILSKETNKVSEWLETRFRVVEKLHQDLILGFIWLQSVNP